MDSHYTDEPKENHAFDAVARSPIHYNGRHRLFYVEEKKI